MELAAGSEIRGGIDMKLFRRTLCIGAASLTAMLVLPGASMAQDVIKIRASIDTNLQHTRSKAFEMFAEEVKKRSNGAMEVELYHSAQLFNDKDVPRALRRGQIEMGAPGVWQLDALVPEGGMTMLPMFYGLPAEATYAVVDGPVGEEINQAIEEGLGVKVIGRWTDLGFQHTYSTGKPIEAHEDLKGMKIRIPGGALNAFRVEAMGATPQLVPWADVPLALQQGAVDGLITTNMSADSAKLWDSGVKHSFQDQQYFGQYVPMVGQDFWEDLSPEQQKVITESWAAIIDQAREDAAAGQEAALAALRKNDVAILEPSQEVLSQWREKLTATQADLVEELGMDEELVERTRAEIEKNAS
jgi:tripartite ATP-independent transporter DctP family solute receptor